MFRSIIALALFLNITGCKAQDVKEIVEIDYKNSSENITKEEADFIDQFHKDMWGVDFFSNYEKSVIGDYTIYKKIGKEDQVYILKNGFFLTKLDDSVVSIFDKNTKVPLSNKEVINYDLNFDTLNYGKNSTVFTDKSLDGIDMQGKVVQTPGENQQTQRFNMLLGLNTIQGEKFYLDGKECSVSKPVSSQFACCNLGNVTTLMTFNDKDGWKKAKKKAEQLFKCK